MRCVPDKLSGFIQLSLAQRRARRTRLVRLSRLLRVEEVDEHAHALQQQRALRADLLGKQCLQEARLRRHRRRRRRGALGLPLCMGIDVVRVTAALAVAAAAFEEVDARAWPLIATGACIAVLGSGVASLFDLAICSCDDVSAGAGKRRAAIGLAKAAVSACPALALFDGLYSDSNLVRRKSVRAAVRVLGRSRLLSGASSCGGRRFLL